MNRPEAPDQVDGVNPNDLAAREQFRESSERQPIPRVVERRDQRGIVANVEIRVARRNVLTITEQRLRENR